MDPSSRIEINRHLSLRGLWHVLWKSSKDNDKRFPLSNRYWLHGRETTGVSGVGFYRISAAANPESGHFSEDRPISSRICRMPVQLLYVQEITDKTADLSTGVRIRQDLKRWNPVQYCKLCEGAVSSALRSCMWLVVGLLVFDAVGLHTRRQSCWCCSLDIIQPDVAQLRLMRRWRTDWEFEFHEFIRQLSLSKSYKH